ncbi:hypothetical protein TNCT_297711 [Trichonephila clavata]|uniref:Uncharacterized protein n=1 Tax=Trichonephila clavata TaxID=2740835 RepID=A0A8X6HNQ9_TRICU|nr:hypothetical protein TNCT_297711 [Trichonephila clavata]
MGDAKEIDKSNFIQAEIERSWGGIFSPYKRLVSSDIGNPIDFCLSRALISVKMRLHLVLLVVLAVMAQWWTAVNGQGNGSQNWRVRFDRMICQTGCPFLSTSHRDGCCTKYRYNRCC